MKKFHIIVIILITLYTLFLLYNRLAFINVIVKFDALEPFEKQMNVYFKGFKIGQTTKIYPDKNYQNTYLKLRLYRAKINLPSNVTVKIRKIKAGSYVEVLSPDVPVLKKLKDNDEIHGIITKDINSLLEGQLSDEDLNVIVDDAASLIENANTAVQTLNGIFIEVRGILQEIRPDIKVVTSNLATTSYNLKKSSKTVSDAIESEIASDSFENIAKTTENIKNISENINEITKQIDDVTIPLTNNILCETQSTMHNANEISCGVKKTLKKHFGFGRILFGRPISK